MRTVKKIGVFLLLLFSFLSSLSYADTDEENTCFSLLNSAIKRDPRFTDLNTKGLEEVVINGAKVNLSTYANPDDSRNPPKHGFLDFRSKNPAWSTLSEDEKNILGKDATGKPFRTEYDFLARRTNIATVITGDTFVVSNIVGIGKTSNFRFPLPITQKEKDKGEKEFGDHWVVTSGDNVFQEYVLYAHHNIQGEFLSCGLFHITPLGGYSYTTLQEGNYYGNVIQGKKEHTVLSGKNREYGNKCMSGFRGEKDGDFYKMETNVCVMDFGENDFARMEILAIAYNNKSTYFNEYDIFPIQVSSMVADRTSDKTLQDVRENFLQGLENETCLSIVHKTTSTLPSKCNGEYKSLHSYIQPSINGEKKKSLFASFLHFFVPTSHAARDFSPSEETIQKSQGLVVFTNFPLELYKKLQSIPNETFKEYALFALNPGYGTYIERKQSEGQYLSAFEKTFLNCNISHKERTDVFIDLLEKIDINNFDIANLSYSNPKVGDCIIPYPDVTHRDQEIEGSFDANIRLAQILNGTWKTPVASDAVIALIQEENALHAEFEKQKTELMQQFEEGLLTDDELDEKITDVANHYDEQIKKHQDKYHNSINQKNTEVSTGTLSQTTKMYITIAVILLLGVLLLGFAFRTKQK